MTSYEYKLEIAQAECLAYNQMTGRFSSCPTCKGKGYIRFIKVFDGYPYTPLKPCPDCHNQNKTDMKLAIASIDKDLNFDTYKVHTSWQRQIKESAKNFNERFFYIGGQSGCGKTHICSAICIKFAEQDLTIRVMRWNEDSKRLKTMAMDGEYQFAIDEYKSRCDVLYIDDLYKGDVTDADIKLAFEIIDYRYRNRLKTIISSEWLLPELTRMDSAVGGRIEEMSKNHCHNIGRDEARNWRRK